MKVNVKVNNKKKFLHIPYSNSSVQKPFYIISFWKEFNRSLILRLKFNEDQ